LKRICAEAIRLLKSGESFVQVTILASSGSVPRESGACMLWLADGSIRGTVGGGSLEAGVIRLAPQVFEARNGQTINIVLDGSDAVAAGMICGGSATVRLDYVDAEVRSNLEHFEALDATIKSGADADGTVYIFGAGHCGMALAPVLSALEFRTAIIDDREEFANSSRFPLADEIVVPQSMDLSFADYEWGAHSYIVIVTRGHVHDQLVLESALKTNAGYIGMIGSSKKRESIYKKLLEKGYTQADLDRVCSPIGIPIDAQTPEEIAISIAAELIKERTSKRKTAPQV